MLQILFFITLCTANFIYSMDKDRPADGTAGYPIRQAMSEGNELIELVPPAHIRMDEYEHAAGPHGWLHTKEEMQTYADQITKNPLYLQICADPLQHAEMVDSMVSETKNRICGHLASGCRAAISPCTPALWAAFFAYRACKSAQKGENCCPFCGISCVATVVTCGRCSKSARTMRGITKETQKSCKALAIFRSLQQIPEEEHEKTK